MPKGKIRVPSSPSKQNTYRLKSLYLPPLSPNVLPQLKPSHPHHSMNIPSTTFVNEHGGGFLRPWSNLPWRGPRIRQAASPAAPPTKCMPEQIKYILKNVIY